MGLERLSRSRSGSLRVPLAASLLLHAALLGLLARGLPRALPEPGASVEVRLVSLEAEEGAGAGMGEVGAGRPAEARRPLPGRGGVDRTAGAIARETLAAGSPPEPAASPAPSVEPPAGEPPRAGQEAPAAAPPALLSAPPPPASVAARVVSQAPMAVEGPKAALPELSLGTPSDFEVLQGPPLTGEALPGQGPAAARSDTAGPGGALGAPGGGRGARQEGRTGTGSLGTGTGHDGILAHILRRIEGAKRYPEEARRIGHRGTVAVRFRIGSDGAVAAAEVAASSGSSLLDAASLETVRRAAPLPAVPGWLRVRISYGLAEARP